jgi:D-proline reductase (dithiol) PrdB
VYEAGQVAFHYLDDASFRVIDAQVERSKLRTAHFAYDMTDARRDINCVFPIDTLHALAAEGTIGSVARELYTFMGGIYSARRVREELAPALVERALAADIDLMLLVPA